MSLADLLKPASVANLLKPADKAAAAIAKLQAELEEAQAKLEAINTDYSEALLVEEESGDSSASDRLEKQWTAAKREVQKKSAALTAATARHQVAVSDARTREATEAWTRAETLSVARTAAAERLAKSAGTFAADYLSLLQLTRELCEAIPSRPDLVAASLTQAQIEIAVRKEVLRCGVDWALSWPWGRVSLPAFMEPFEGANQVIRGWKANALAGLR